MGLGGRNNGTERRGGFARSPFAAAPGTPRLAPSPLPMMLNAPQIPWEGLDRGMAARGGRTPEPKRR